MLVGLTCCAVHLCLAYEFCFALTLLFVTGNVFGGVIWAWTLAVINTQATMAPVSIPIIAKCTHIENVDLLC